MSLCDDFLYCDSFSDMISIHLVVSLPPLSCNISFQKEKGVHKTREAQETRRFVWMQSLQE